MLAFYNNFLSKYKGRETGNYIHTVFRPFLFFFLMFIHYSIS